MNFEPQKFFIGLVDFFSVLLPGAVLAFILSRSGLAPFGYRLDEMSGSAGWMAFLFASYLLGHLLFLVGSLLDDLAYARLERWGTEGQIRHIVAHRTRLSWPLRLLGGLVFKRRGEKAVAAVERLKDARLEAIDGAAAVNAFQWCKARLAFDKPEALVMVSRFEADSKFFRSFVPLLAGLLLWALWRCDVFETLALLVALVLAFWRYVEQRFKAVQLACFLLLTLESERRDPLPDGASTAHANADVGPDALTHAGGVVRRLEGDTYTCLLVQASRNRAHWVLPKGHIEPRETPEHCAVREVHEESGVWACVGPLLGDVASGGAEQRMTRYYLMDYLGADKPEEPWRASEWLPSDAAIAKATFPDQRGALESAGALAPAPRLPQ